MTETRPYTYNHIPQLPELMPSTGGVVGVEYLQCTVGNLRAAQDVKEEDGGPWGGIIGGSKIYTIVGPEGSADMHLLCRGKPIPGGDVNSGARFCVVDGDVEQLTGLKVKPVEEPEPETDPVSETIAKAVKDTG